MSRKITHHHDGHGLNDVTVIEANKRGPGNASHLYGVWREDIKKSVAGIQFQCGPRHEKGSIPGILDPALVAILIDRYEGFQSGSFACAENEIVLTHLRGALQAMKDRVDRRAEEGTLGTNEGN